MNELSVHHVTKILVQPAKERDGTKWCDIIIDTREGQSDVVVACFTDSGVNQIEVEVRR